MLAKEDFNNDLKDAGELGAGHTVTALYEIVPAQGFVEDRGVDPLVYQKNPQRISGNSNDLMTVKLRYKEPKGSTSKLLKKTVTQREVHSYIQSDNLRFASAVAEFGLLLRNSPYRGQASFDQVLSRARSSKQDEFGYRAEFIGLVQQARSLSPYITPVPMPEPLIYQNYPHENSRGKGQK
jgi:Ca-activated chloride channel family protein